MKNIENLYTIGQNFYCSSIYPSRKDPKDLASDFSSIFLAVLLDKMLSFANFSKDSPYNLYLDIFREDLAKYIIKGGSFPLCETIERQLFKKAYTAPPKNDKVFQKGVDNLIRKRR